MDLWNINNFYSIQSENYFFHPTFRQYDRTGKFPKQSSPNIQAILQNKAQIDISKPSFKISFFPTELNFLPVSSLHP
jgi:hypothetical protein